MDRQIARNAAIALCAAWAAGCGTVWAQDTSTPPSAASADAVQAANSDADSLPTTLEGEIARAHLLRTQGKYADAGKALGQLMLVAPDNPRVVSEYAKVLIQQGRPQDALPFVKRALELQANDWTLYSALGVACDQTDDHAQAKLAYEHALALRPGAPEVLNNYAVSRMLVGDLDGAQRLLAQASAAGISNDKIANNLAMLASMKHPGSTPLPQMAATTDRGASHPATSMPRTIASAAPRVMMEKVPTDPLAGPVARHTAPPSRLAASRMHKARLAASTTAHKHDAVAHGARPPMLRTAADNQ